MHSREYKNPQSFTGKRVIVIGIGNSGADVTVELSHVTKQVRISYLFILLCQGSWGGASGGYGTGTWLGSADGRWKPWFHCHGRQHRDRRYDGARAAYWSPLTLRSQVMTIDRAHNPSQMSLPSGLWFWGRADGGPHSGPETGLLCGPCSHVKDSTLGGWKLSARRVAGGLSSPLPKGKTAAISPPQSQHACQCKHVHTGPGRWLTPASTCSSLTWSDLLQSNVSGLEAFCCLRLYLFTYLFIYLLT